MKKKVALITGISGQDGSYLAELLLEKDYEVWGIIRRNSAINNKCILRVESIADKIHLEYGDVTDMSCLLNIIRKCNPDEIYNLAAQSHVRISFDNPIFTSNVNATGVLNLLETIRIINPKIKMYQASSSEMFGNSIDPDGFQRELTPMRPVSPYGNTKLYAYNLMKNYRESYDMFLVNGILFNHESPRRGENFVTQKVVKAAVEIKRDLRDNLVMGNLTACRDWGHAKDYVKAMHLIMQQDEPDDYVCSTGVTHSVKELVEYTFGKLNLDWKEWVEHDDIYERATELNLLKGDCSKLKAIGWVPEYTFEDTLDEMIEYWLERL